jgi:hypothetical protein
VAVLAHECAAAFVALPDGASDLSRDVARIARVLAHRTLRARAEFLFLEQCDGQIEHAVEGRGQITVRNCVAEEYFGPLQLVVRVLADAEGDVVPITRDRDDLGPRNRYVTWPRGQLAHGLGRNLSHGCKRWRRRVDDHGHGLRAGRTLGDESLDFEPALAGSHGDQLLGVLWREARREQDDSI